MFTQQLNEQETGAPKTLKQLTDYMLDYVGAVNISVGSSNSAYYNTKNKTMHFYTSGDDFGTTTNYLKKNSIQIGRQKSIKIVSLLFHLPQLL
jgi:hypothetical protein